MRSDVSIRTAFLVWLTLAGVASAQPLSAIDWLTDSLNAPPSEPAAFGPPEQPTAQPSTPAPISVRPLGASSLDGLGTLAPEATGLDAGLWEASDVPTLTRLMDSARAERLPALRRQLIAMLQASARPSGAASRDGDLLLARVDRLLDLGALTEARDILELTDLSQPEIFRRWFDIELLLGQGRTACTRLAEAPDLDPTLPTRIYCLAMLGDWEAAALNLETALTLDLVSPAEDALLRRYLDESNAIEDGPLTLPNVITPLTFRLYEAVGEPAPTEVLPRAFAWADLAETGGWKGRLKAAERLTAAGVLAPQTLFEFYVEHRPSASGGTFDRAARVQAFTLALEAGDAEALRSALPRVWSEMVNADLGTAFAEVYAARLAAAPLDGPEATLAHRIGLLAGFDGDPDGGFLDALARGAPTLAAAGDARAGLIQQGYGAEALPQNLQMLIDEGRTGEAALVALDLFAAGAEGDAEDLVNAIRLMRALGLEPLAHQVALELMILDPRG